MKAAVQESPPAAGLPLANWNWKVVRQFSQARFGRYRSRSSCLNYLHLLGVACKRPKKRFGKADPAQREAFVAAYAQLGAQTRQAGGKLWFADEAHFRADADLRGKWTLRGQPALVDSSSPRWGEQASYCSAVCLETGEVAVMELAGNSTAAASAAFLQQLGSRCPEPLMVIWDNGPAHRGEAIRQYLATPDLRLRLAPLPPYSPDRNEDEAIWKWARAAVTASACLGSKAQLQERLGAFFRGLADRSDEVIRRWGAVLQAKVAALASPLADPLEPTTDVDSTLALV